MPHFGQEPITADVLTGPFDPGGQPNTRSGQPLELGFFAWNIQGGATASKAVLTDPERYQTYWQWPIASRLVLEAERIGFDYQVPFARWIGQGGETQWNDALLESLTSAAAVSSITSRMALFSTAHTNFGFHPLHFAKFGATIDHISGGRWGLNLVSGYSAKEFAAFGNLEGIQTRAFYAMKKGNRGVDSFLPVSNPWCSAIQDLPYRFQKGFARCQKYKLLELQVRQSRRPCRLRHRRTERCQYYRLSRLLRPSSALRSEPSMLR